MAAAGLFAGLIAIWLRIFWLQVVEHGFYSERADASQEQRVLLPAERGNLVDRRGRVLARDLVTYSVSAAPAEMLQAGVTARQLAGLLGLDPQRLRRSFSQRPRFLWVARHVAPPVAQQIADLKARGVYLAPETERVYPLGKVAEEILGHTNLDNIGVEGLELQLDETLHGQAGWATIYRDGRGRSHDLPRGLRRPPHDGLSVVLTLDADLQSIVESHLAAAVDSLNALRGFALFLDPSTGEVLADVTVPHVGPGKDRNWNFTDTFEPGSTYKVVVAGAALEEGLAKPNQVFTASATGEYQIVPGVTFHDVHKSASYTFADAVRWSSNIVMGKLGLLVGPERLYRYSTALGFGSLTGVAFPGEAGGKLRSPDRWSARSTPTIAIGHEIAVTPLQLTLAYAAIANNGVLMRPTLVREIRNSSGEVVQRFTPEASHRVFSPSTCTTLRTMLEAVVDSGTAKAARIPGLSIAGKTGTAQKYDAAQHTYGRGLYVSSFCGFAPADAPQIVGVVVIDEPRGRHYYGGEVAAPVFKQVMLDLRSLPNGTLVMPASPTVTPPPAPGPVTVPDLRLLPPRAADRTLAEAGLHGRFQGEGPRVLAQSPAAGTAVERGSRVEAWLSAPTDSSGATLPELVGLTLREAMRELSRRQVACKVSGHGTVIDQSPPPGTALPFDGVCVLRCEPRLREPSKLVDLGRASGPDGPGVLAGVTP